MPPIPTVQNGSENDRIVRPQDRKSDIICRAKYSNNLPDIPFDLKFLTFPFEFDRFTQYKPTSLERNYKFEVLSEHDLGVSIDLINRDLYQSDRNALSLDPADEKLLEEDTHAPQDMSRSKQHAKPVSWLRRSEYISTEQTRFQPQNMEKAEAKVGYNVKNSMREETLYMDREQQIAAIEKTFEDNKIPITQHYCKPNVVPIEVYSVYPDFKCWKYPYAQVIFDADPSPGGKSLANQLEEMGQAMIRGVMDESGEQFVAYFLPTEETLEKRRVDFSLERAYEDDAEYEYKMTREYNWNVKSKLSKGYEENYFFVIREDGVYYDELETRVRLSKRRQKVGVQINNTKLVVRHRPLNAIEHRMHLSREKNLEPPGEEEEEEEMEEDVEEKGNDETTTGGDDKRSKSRSRSRSRSRSVASKSKSRSRSRSSSRSRSRSKSKSVSKSRSRSRSPHSRSKSRSRSRSHSSNRSSRSGSANSRLSGSAHSHRSGSEHSHISAKSANSRRSGSVKSHHSGSDRSRKSSSRHSGSGSSSRSGSHSHSNSGSGSDSNSD
ncbi:hypothetical protein PVAND_011692 [Polypedilum vanderplanki]|uniref:RNA polymerase II-associated factor 1 homolog n=1 Tax=Polypedilum vanderplanki TaxID=319348 RepID=A0A9J6CK45_POLVA|nr:hypothetical protein PVAND_011692 [Polypedilum vanderplanki]